MVGQITSVALLLPVAIMSMTCIGISMSSRLSTAARVSLLLAGETLCSMNFLMQISHTWSDVMNENISCILDTQGTLLVCSIVLFVLVVTMSVISCWRIVYKLKYPA